MRKADDKADVQVGQFFEFTPDQLRTCAMRLEVAARERANPGETITIQAAPGLIFFYDPKVLRSDIERQVRPLPLPKALIPTSPEASV